MSDHHDHNTPKQFEKKPPSLTRHNQIIDRLAKINLELVNTINELAAYDIEISDEEVMVAANTITSQGSKIHLTSLAKRMEEGAPETMLATFNINTGKIYPPNANYDLMTIKILQYLIDKKEYVIIGDSNNVVMYCVELKLPVVNERTYMSKVTFQPEIGELCVATIGPNKQIRLKKSVEELKELFVEYDYDSSDLDDLMKVTSDSLNDDDVIYVNLEATKLDSSESLH